MRPKYLLLLFEVWTVAILSTASAASIKRRRRGRIVEDGRYVQSAKRGEADVFLGCYELRKDDGPCGALTIGDDESDIMQVFMSKDKFTVEACLSRCNWMEPLGDGADKNPFYAAISHSWGCFCGDALSSRAKPVSDKDCIESFKRNRPSSSDSCGPAAVYSIGSVNPIPAAEGRGGKEVQETLAEVGENRTYADGGGPPQTGIKEPSSSGADPVAPSPNPSPAGWNTTNTTETGSEESQPTPPVRVARTPRRASTESVLVVAFGTVGAVVAALSLFVLAWYFYRKKRDGASFRSKPRPTSSTTSISPSSSAAAAPSPVRSSRRPPASWMGSIPKERLSRIFGNGKFPPTSPAGGRSDTPIPPMQSPAARVHRKSRSLPNIVTARNHAEPYNITYVPPPNPAPQIPLPPVPSRRPRVPVTPTAIDPPSRPSSPESASRPSGQEEDVEPVFFFLPDGEISWFVRESCVVEPLNVRKGRAAERSDGGRSQSLGREDARRPLVGIEEEGNGSNWV